MNEIPKKNYYILVMLVLVVILLTLSLARIYKNREKLSSSFYNYSNKITSKEFDEYMTEMNDLIIYVSDKYDLTNESFESQFKKKIDLLNLKDKLLYIDKSELSKSFIKKLSKNYDIRVDISKLPMIFIIIDNQVIKSIYVDSNMDVDSVIDYEVFE